MRWRHVHVLAPLLPLLVVPLVMPLLALPAGAAGPPRADAAVLVTASPPGAAAAHVAPAVAVSPRNDQVVAVAHGDAYSGHCGVHVSRNGGLTWAAAATPEIPPQWPRCSFVTFGPVADVAFASDGTLYYAFGGMNPTTYEARIFLARSDDLGASWQTTPVPGVERDLPRGEMGTDGLPSLAVDPRDPQRVVVGWGSNWAAWTLTDEVRGGNEYYYEVVGDPYLAVSADGGQTFGEPVLLDEGVRLSDEVEGYQAPPQVLVGNDGTVLAVFGEYARPATREREGKTTLPAHIYLAVTGDGGQTVSTRAIHTQSGPEGGGDFLWVPMAAIDRGSGDLYVAWEEMGEGVPRIQVMRSADGGASWSDPVTVNDAEPARDWDYPELWPAISVAPGGRVDVAWYDWRHDPAFGDSEAERSHLQDVYASHSIDRGRTWATNVRVTDRSIDRRFGVWDEVGDIRGPIGLASWSGGSYVAWSDTRGATEATHSQDVYFTRVWNSDRAGVFARTGAAPSPVLFGVLGAGAALLMAGALLIVAARLRDRAHRPQRVRT